MTSAGSSSASRVKPSPTRGVNALDEVLDAFTRAWTAWVRQPSPLVIGSVLLLAMQLALQCSGQVANLVPQDAATSMDPVVLVGMLAAALGAIALAVVLGFVQFFAACFIGAGMLRAAVAALDGAEGTPALWSGRDRMLPVAGWRFLTRLLCVVVFAACLAPGAGLAVWAVIAESWARGAGAVVVMLAGLVPCAYVLLGFLFGECFIVLEGEPVFDALARSWDLARGRRLPLLAYTLLAGCVSGLGLAPGAGLAVSAVITQSWAVAALGLLAWLGGIVPAAAYLQVVHVDVFRRLRSPAPESP